LQRDPLGLTGGVNLYVYAGNNPVGRIDPQGTFEVDPGDVGDSPEMENPRVSEGTADLDTNELPYHTDSSVDPETADALAKDFAGGIDDALGIYGAVPGLPQGNFINAARAARDGKYAKATWETCKGLIGCVPGPGTAINITIDTTELLLSNADGTSGGSAIGGVPTANYSNR
ncbi:MAG: RHS repeat-associated core domain-containing protein, partial [Pseudomonadota bacterium]